MAKLTREQMEAAGFTRAQIALILNNGEKFESKLTPVEEKYHFRRFRAKRNTNKLEVPMSRKQCAKAEREISRSAKPQEKTAKHTTKQDRIQELRRYLEIKGML